MHAEPLRLIKAMHSDSVGQTIEDFINRLRLHENEMRKTRNADFCRVYGESQLFEKAHEYELKNSTKINIKMIRMYHYNKSNDVIKFKEIPCFCFNCLDGQFDKCEILVQPIVSSDIVPASELRKLRNQPEDVMNDSFEQREDITTEPIIFDSNLDVKFFKDYEIEEHEPVEIEHKKKADVSFCGSEESSSPTDDFQTSSQKFLNTSLTRNQNISQSSYAKSVLTIDEDGNLLPPSPINDDGNLFPSPPIDDEDPVSPIIVQNESIDKNLRDADEAFIMRRLNYLDQQYLLPENIGLEKKDFLTVFDKKGKLYGTCIDYIGNMLMKNSENDCVILRCELYNWLHASSKFRFAWKNNIMCSESKFENAKERFQKF